MHWMDGVSNILRQYTGGGEAQPDTHEHFDQIATAAPKASLADGLAEAFRSKETPSFGQMVSHLFNQSTGEQKAGLLTRLLSSGGPGLLSQIGVAGLPGLASLLGRENREITPDEAQRVSPEEVQQVAAQAERQNPSLIDTVSNFYAEHPTLIKMLSAAALTIAMRKIAQRNG